jgi:flagellar hook-length control protein FliK
MLESKNGLLDIGRASNPASAAPSGLGKGSAGKNPEQFSTLLGDAAAGLKAAKSGNSMPLTGQPQVPAGDIDPATLLSSRTLKGGTALMIGGAEPTDAGLIAFARAQGMDPKLLGLLTENTAQGVSSSALKQGPALETAVDINAGFQATILKSTELKSTEPKSTEPKSTEPKSTELKSTELKSTELKSTELKTTKLNSSEPEVSRLNSLLANPDATFIPAPAMQPQQSGSSEMQVADKALKVGSAEGAATPGATTGAPKPELQLAVPGDKFLTAQQLQQRVQSNQSAPSAGLPSGQQVLKTAVEAAINAQSANSQEAKPQASNSSTNSSQSVAQNITQQAAMSAAKGALAKTSNHANTLDIKPKNAIASVKLSASAATAEPQANPLEAAKITVGPKMAEAFLKQHRDRQNMPATKMDAINLVANKLLTATGPSALTGGPLVSAGVAPAPLFVEGQVNNSTAQTSLNASLSSETPAEDARQDSLRRQDDYMQLSRQLTDALGKRLTAQIQRGSWQVEMDLHPKSLGRIEVQLEMKNGELEARFITANATTRDLINEGMPRLREALQEHGTETASMDLGSANQGAADGKSTGSGNDAEGSNDRLSADVESDSPKASPGISDDGLDVLV